MTHFLAGCFPGQGSQSVGMGKDFYSEFPIAKQTFEEASDALKLDLKKLCFEGPESDLTLTENAQPAILTTSIACYRVAQSTFGFKGHLYLGHSLGEYSALVAAEAFSFSQAVIWVRERGLAMQKAVPVGEGTMAAILGAEDSQLEEWCKEATQLAQHKRKTETVLKTDKLPYTVPATVEAANYNAPGQIVVSGSVDAVEALEKLITEKNIRGVMAKRLPVSAPFHCSLMLPARKRMEQLFQESKNQLQPLKTAYIPNRTARATQEVSVVTELLAEQVDHSVLWKQSMETLFNQPCSMGFEFGPGKILQGLAKRIAKTRNTTFEMFGVYDLESLKAAEVAYQNWENQYKEKL